MRFAKSDFFFKVLTGTEEKRVNICVRGVIVTSSQYTANIDSNNFSLVSLRKTVTAEEVLPCRCRFAFSENRFSQLNDTARTGFRTRPSRETGTGSLPKPRIAHCNRFSSAFLVSDLSVFTGSAASPFPSATFLLRFYRKFGSSK